MRPFGLILAGGEARRMGGADKALLPFRGSSLIAAVIARFAPQVEALALSANGDPARFRSFGLPVLPDAQALHLGPMAGVLAGLDWLADQGGTHLATVPVDTPFLPGDLVAQLVLAGEGTGGLALAASGGRAHPVCALWPLGLRDRLAAAILAGERRIGRWSAAEGAAEAPFSDRPFDPFLNINTLDDLAMAEALAAG